MKKSVAILSLVAISACAIFTDPKTAGEFPVYGNWCGPSHPAEGTNPKPINRTDLACKRHDGCYSAKGYLNTTCDDNLIAELKNTTPQSETEKLARKAIIAYFKRSPKL